MFPSVASVFVLLVTTCPFSMGAFLKDDTTSVTQEPQCYKPENHRDGIIEWMHSTGAAVQRSIDCLDIFGASGRIKRTWEDAGFASLGFDVKISADHDLCSETGFFTLLHMGLQLKRGGIMICAPPCSLMGPACSSVHRRTKLNPRGNERNFKTRLSNRIWESFAIAVGLLLEIRPSIFVLVEQPSGSWGLKQHFILSLMAAFGMFKVVTWMGLFDHDLPKCTHLASNLRTVSNLRRKLSMADRQMIRDRFAQRQQQRVVKKDYHKKCKKSDGSFGWQGGRDLASSAMFTIPFCKALLQSWMDREPTFEEGPEDPADLMVISSSSEDEAPPLDNELVVVISDEETQP